MTKYIIDTDTASDDAVALIMALRDPTCDVVAITTVAGNVSLEQATKNALISVEMSGVTPPPVYKGIGKPLVRDQINATHVHGMDGLGDVGYPDPKLQIEEEHAVPAMLRTIRECDTDIELITLGPLTNVAVAMMRDMETMKKLRRIVIMGGAQLGYNARTDCAEFNILCDPEAANVVFQSGIPIVMVPLEVCCGETKDIMADTEITEEEQAMVKGFGNPVADFVIDCNCKLRETTLYRVKRATITLPDPTTVAVALRPGLVEESYPCNVVVDTSGSLTYGQTVIIPPTGSLHVEKTDKCNVTVVAKLDGQGFKDYLFSLIR